MRAAAWRLTAVQSASAAPGAASAARGCDDAAPGSESVDVVAFALVAFVGSWDDSDSGGSLGDGSSSSRVKRCTRRTSGSAATGSSHRIRAGRRSRSAGMRKSWWNEAKRSHVRGSSWGSARSSWTVWASARSSASRMSAWMRSGRSGPPARAKARATMRASSETLSRCASPGSASTATMYPSRDSHRPTEKRERVRKETGSAMPPARLCSAVSMPHSWRTLTGPPGGSRTVALTKHVLVLVATTHPRSHGAPSSARNIEASEPREGIVRAAATAPVAPRPRAGDASTSDETRGPRPDEIKRANLNRRRICRSTQSAALGRGTITYHSRGANDESTRPGEHSHLFNNVRAA